MFRENGKPVFLDTTALSLRIVANTMVPLGMGKFESAVVLFAVSVLM